MGGSVLGYSIAPLARYLNRYTLEEDGRLLKHEIIYDLVAIPATYHLSPLTLSSQDTVTKGWSGGLMVLGKLPVPGRPTI